MTVVQWCVMLCPNQFICFILCYKLYNTKICYVHVYLDVHVIQGSILLLVFCTGLAGGELALAL